MSARSPRWLGRSSTSPGDRRFHHHPFARGSPQRSAQARANATSWRRDSGDPRPTPPVQSTATSVVACCIALLPAPPGRARRGLVMMTASAGSGASAPRVPRCLPRPPQLSSGAPAARAPTSDGARERRPPRSPRARASYVKRGWPRRGSCWHALEFGARPPRRSRASCRGAKAQRVSIARALAPDPPLLPHGRAHRRARPCAPGRAWAARYAASCRRCPGVRSGSPDRGTHDVAVSRVCPAADRVASSVAMDGCWKRDRREIARSTEPLGRRGRSSRAGRPRPRSAPPHLAPISRSRPGCVTNATAGS